MTTQRLEALSDGVFSIAITLLVLDVRPPALPHGHAAELPRALFAQWPHLASYALSFAIIGVYWVAHHIMMHAIRYADNRLLWMNLLFLLWIGLIPASAGLLGEYRDQPVAVAAYGLNLVLASSTMRLFWDYAARQGLMTDSVPADLVRRGRLRPALAALLYLAAALLAFVDTRISVFLYCLGPILYIALQKNDGKVLLQDV